jgi:hypothetical protein
MHHPNSKLTPTWPLAWVVAAALALACPRAVQAQTNAGDTNTADTKPADTNTADTKPADTNTADTKPADTKPAGFKSIDSTPAESPIESATPKRTPFEALMALEAPKATSNERVRSSAELADALVKRLPRLRGKRIITEAQRTRYESQITAWSTTLSIAADGLALVYAAKAAKPSADPAEARIQTAAVARQQANVEASIAAAENGLKALENELAALEETTGWNLVGTLLRARCNTAICFDNGQAKDWIGIEPLVELPVGKSFALSNSALSSYVNNHELRIDLAAGARVWLFRDVVSFSIYISKPLTDAPVRLEGSPFVYPAASVRRPYPGFAIGLLFDSLWLGFDRDELRNGDGQDSAALNSDFPPNEGVSSTWTLTVALQPVTAFRSAIGTAVQSTKGDNP